MVAALLVLFVAGCSPAVPSASRGSTVQPVGSTQAPATVPAPTPAAPAGCPSCPADVRAAPALPAGPLFAGRLLIYATHGFSAGEVAALGRRIQGPVTPVFSSEQMVASGVAGFPDIAVDTLIADPTSYAAAADVPQLAAEMATGVVLAAAEATLRKARVGDRIRFADGRSALVTAVVDAHVIGGHEMATGPSVLHPGAGTTADYLLVGATSVAALTRVAQATWPTRTIRVRARTTNGYLSGVDTVLTQLQAKLHFGEFSSRPAGAGTFVPDPAWIDAHLRTARIVQLGQVTCNTAIMRPLASAMAEVTARGLGALINTADFQYEGGCWNPRAARALAGGTLSSHSWGMAIDINVAANPLGAAPHQDPRLVAIMAAHGFAWGGRFLRPDGAHFEWVGDLAQH